MKVHCFKPLPTNTTPKQQPPHICHGLLQEAYRLQLRCFLGLVSEQRHLPSLKQLLKLYTAISLPKLASLVDMDEPTLRSQLMLLKVRATCSAGPVSLTWLEARPVAWTCVNFVS